MTSKHTPQENRDMINQRVRINQITSPLYAQTGTIVRDSKSSACIVVKMDIDEREYAFGRNVVEELS